VEDEARIGQQGTLTSVWARRGSRPVAVKQTAYEWVYLWAAVNLLTGESSALLTPTVNTLWMNAYLEQLSRQVGPQRHVILVLDNAGWHVAKDLKLPANITLLRLPPYSPELNPAERIWAYLRSHYLSNRLYADYDAVFDATASAWNKLTPAHLQSICGCPSHLTRKD
jgi:transposase